MSLSRRAVARGLVAAQFAALMGWAVAGPWLSPWPLGIAVQATGVALGAWAGAWMTWRQRGPFSITPLPDAHACLVTDGPYARIRHPMYTALLAFVLPAALGGPWASAACGLGLLVVLVAKHRLEDRLLAERFPTEHMAWRQRTGALLPRFGRWRAPGPRT